MPQKSWSPTRERQYAHIKDSLALPLIDVVHRHSITRLSLPGPRASFLRTSSG